MNLDVPAPDRMEISQHSGITVLTLLETKLNDAERASALREQLVMALHASPDGRLIIDMKHVEYVTSAALLPFIAARKAAEEKGGQIVLCNLAAVVAKVLTVSQLIVESRSQAHYLAMSDDVESAVRLLLA
jgi:anti-anti-sigma factor